MRCHWAVNERLEGDDSKLFVFGLGNYTQIQVFVITENATGFEHSAKYLSTDYTDGLSSIPEEWRPHADQSLNVSVHHNQGEK